MTIGYIYQNWLVITIKIGLFQMSDGEFRNVFWHESLPVFDIFGQLVWEHFGGYPWEGVIGGSSFPVEGFFML